MPIDGKVIERGVPMKQFSASRTRNPLTVAGDIDAVLVSSSPDTVCIARDGDDANSTVKNSNLGPVRKAMQKAVNLVVYGRPTNTFLDRQKD